jgi:hypothetical protein
MPDLGTELRLYKNDRRRGGFREVISFGAWHYFRTATIHVQTGETRMNTASQGVFSGVIHKP